MPTDRRDPDLFRFATRTAAALTDLDGRPWQPSDHGHPDYPGVYLDGPDHEVLYLRRDQADSRGGKLTVSVHWPQGHTYIFRASEGHPQHPSIGVSIGRGPEVMAKEIDRRLLPGYRRTMAEVLADMDQDREARAARQGAAERLAAILRQRPGRVTVKDDQDGNGTALDWYAPERGLGDGFARLDYRGGEVAELKIRGLTVDQVAAALQAIQAV